MTLPKERSNSISNTREFLRNLLDPNKTPRIPSNIRKEAYYLLKHYPSDYDMDQVAKKAPKVLNSCDHDWGACAGYRCCSKCGAD